MWAIIAFVVINIILPIVTRSERLNLTWIDPYLREIFTGIFVVILLWILNTPQVRGFVEKLHVTIRERRQRVIEYAVCFFIGGFILCGYWWFTGKIVKPPSKQQEGEIPNIGASLIIDDVRDKYINFHIQLNNATGSPMVNNLRYTLKTADGFEKEFIPPKQRTIQPGRDITLEPPSVLVESSAIQ